MALYDYSGALRLGRKQYQTAASKGEYPYLPVLDDILSNTDIVSEVNLGVQDIPLEKVVGTKTRGRTQAFAGNFMPLLGEKTEFGAKWAYLYDHQMNEGIHDPIIAYEFMNKYYVQEGNKRVSVLKYVKAYSICAQVTRLIPRRTDDHDIRLYYEFLDFYQVSFNSDVWFSREGSYARLLEAMGKKPGEPWSHDDQINFKGAYDSFSMLFAAKRTADIEMTASDAFLIYIDIFGYPVVRERTHDQMKKDLTRIWDELLLKSNGDEIDVIEQPTEEAAPKLINWLLPSTAILPEMLRAGFIYCGNRETSNEIYSHELGRMYLDQCFDGALKTEAYYDVDTQEKLSEAISQAIDAHCNVIFTTTPQMAAHTVKAAVEHPEIQFFNCSVLMSYTSIYTYHARLFEAKFVTGALAASLCETDDLGYVADFPSYGRIANINAFAIGARMINPRVRIHLKWAAMKPEFQGKSLREQGITHISGEDLITPGKASREYGLFAYRADGTIENLAMPVCDWGKFYERLLRLLCRRSLDPKGQKGKKSINYWWGMSADVIDVICSKGLPIPTQRLARFLKNAIRNGAIQPFEGPIDAHDGIIVAEDGHVLSPGEVVRMEWLAKSVVGEIPPADQFREDIRSQIRIRRENHAEEANHENPGTGG